MVGSVDVSLQRPATGEALIGKDRNAAYMLNVCVAEAARRRRVGGALVTAALEHAGSMGAPALYVHLMAVNEIGRALYASHGFVLEQEESTNAAHYRGHCLDGIEGRGRTVLLRKDLPGNSCAQ